MRARIRRLRAWYRRPAVRRARQLAIISLGVTTLHIFLKDVDERLCALEGPDEKTVAEGLQKAEGEVRELLGDHVLPAGPHGAGEEGSGVGELE